MSVCLSVSRSVLGCQSLTVTVTVAAVSVQLVVWSGRRNSVVCLSLPVCESMSRHDRGVRWRPCARGPPARPARQAGSDVCASFFLTARRFGLKRFDSVTFCFPICISGFKICEMIVFEVFFSLTINSVQIRFPEML